ncbi:loader of DNA helicase [Synechococcus phage S-CREM1]|nr:loader of DNA helicase [Synechococcus phage S-CREM1]
MTGFEVYQMYLALKLHFTKDDYDYFRFNGKTRASEESFNKRNDSYFFKKLASKYDRDRIQEYFVSNFISDNKGYIKDIIRPSGETIYFNWKKKQDSFLYTFREEVHTLLDNIEFPYEQNFDNLFVCKRGNHPIILTSYLRKEISLETLIIFETCLGYVKRLDKTLTDPVWNQVKTQVIKYAPFLQIDCKKYKSIILKTIKEKV